MLGKIEKIENSLIYIKLEIDVNNAQSLINMFVIMQDTNSSFIGEIVNINRESGIINLLGEYKNNNLIYGVIKKPSFNAKIDLIAPNYVEKIIGNFSSETTSLLIGKSPFYEDVNIYANIDKLFGSHLAIFGSSGSGKSCGFSRIMQNLILKNNLSTDMNLVIFDAFGEYHSAFSGLQGNFAFKAYTSSESADIERICIPPWLLHADDYAILFGLQKTNQISVIEKALRNIHLFKQPEEYALQYKNHILATGILDIISSGKPAAQLRDQIISSLTSFHTKTLNLESIISQPGYDRTFRQCLIIDANNKINAIEAITSYLQSFLLVEVNSIMPDGSYPYTLDDFGEALDYALISEGIWKSDRVFDDANYIKVKFNSLISSENRALFDYPTYISKNDYVKNLFITSSGQKAQIINFNIDSLDDRLAKIMVKIYSKLFFDYAKSLPNKASMPFNLFLEEAHRYVNRDNDVELLGYNIFERIAKEGRKYGVLLGLISQRPCELSETCLSQCSNFIIFKITHPVDLDFIARVIPNITEEILARMKAVLSGFCIAFGSAFKIPSLIKLEMPNPAPNSSSADISKIWFNN